MKTHFSIVIWMLAISMLMKMIVFIMGWQFTGYENIYFFGNLFVIMTGVFLGIRLFKSISTEKTKFISDLKAGMKVAGLYAVLMSVFVYTYYAVIDVEYFPTKLSNQLTLLRESGATEAELVQSENTGKLILSAQFHSTVTLILFLLLGTFYSSIITFFVRKVRQEA